MEVKVTLSFDNGSTEVTPTVLDILRDRGHKVDIFRHR
jgi:peptidoglycan/xylan/chitin deacetylase (PgdA/CDA1 family)